MDRLLGTFRTVKASGAEHREGQRIHAAAQDARRADIRAAKWQAIAGNTAGLAIRGRGFRPLKTSSTGSIRTCLNGLAVPLVSFNAATVSLFHPRLCSSTVV